MIRIISIQH